MVETSSRYFELKQMSIETHCEKPLIYFQQSTKYFYIEIFILINFIITLRYYVCRNFLNSTLHSADSSKSFEFTFSETHGELIV